ncbi:FAD-dependent oxidoreductase [Streptomyces gamaensis]|uniref:FAD-dependent oxidoreductase n=1 Tax=Streptomyces gamaensis TaxID=1763542 RepID=A0ABW0YZR0_9ACTN
MAEVEHRAGIPRRTVARYGAAGAAGLGVRGARRRAGDGRRVAVLGAGVGGLTAAHELAERGFEVTVYERRAVPGGKARSQYVPHSGTGGRRDLPGEHGHRAVFGFYHNLPDTLRRVPRPGGGSVFDNLVPVTWIELARDGDRVNTPVPVRPWRPRLGDAGRLVRTLAGVLDEQFRLPVTEALFLAKQFVMLFTSCEERRFGQWEYVDWWHYIQADRMSLDYQLIWGNSVQLLQALRPSTASARTAGQGYAAVFNDLLGRGSDGPADRIFNGPTSEAWLDLWAAHLRHGLGVRFAHGCTVEHLEVRDGRIAWAGARARGGERVLIGADWFVVAVPAERAVRLWNPAVRAADPRLVAMDRLQYSWTNGAQFFLRRPAAVTPGHIVHVDSPWKLVSVNQSAFWRAPFARTWGDGEVGGSVSVDISDWDTPGILYGRPARKCTRAEVAREVWAQMQAHLNKGGRRVLDDAMLHSWWLDEDIVEGGGELRNEEPFLMNSTGSWDLRPEASTALANLFLAADYVRVHSNIDLASMECANEAGRRAAGAVLRAAGAHGVPDVPTFRGFEPPELAPLKAADRARWRRGLPHVLDTERRAAPSVAG